MEDITGPHLTGQTLPFHDEAYWNLTGDPSKITVLASSKEDGADRPILFTMEPGKGRVFTSIMGHFSGTYNDPLFRLIVFRGINWAAHQPPDRFSHLIWEGIEKEN